MKSIIVLLTFFSICTISFVAAQEKKKSLNCDIGPVKKVYGKTNWLLYSCNDNKSIVIVSDTGNPAMPFYFSFIRTDENYVLHGEGTGNKKATAAAYKDIEKLDEKDIIKLIIESRKVKKHSGK